MKIILSPAKTFSKRSEPIGTIPYFLSDAIMLNHRLSVLSKEDLKQSMHLSNNLVDLVFDYIKQFHTYQTKAIYAYDGQVFKMLDVLSLDNDTIDYMYAHVYILSGLYGILKPSDLISYYRLEMKDTTIINLYEYWKPRINHYITTEIKDDIIINLASEEYARLLTDPRIITIDFILNKDGKKQRPAMLMKTMRGLFARHLLEKRITKLKDLKKIVINDFYYNEKLSTVHTLTFIKEIL